MRSINQHPVPENTKPIDGTSRAIFMKGAIPLPFVSMCLLVSPAFYPFPSCLFDANRVLEDVCRSFSSFAKNWKQIERRQRVVFTFSWRKSPLECLCIPENPGEKCAEVILRTKDAVSLHTWGGETEMSHWVFRVLFVLVSGCNLHNYASASLAS